MKPTGNTIFITGGGSGIGRGLAEALHAIGNKVIISGRRRSVLEEVTKANWGMVFVELDIESPASIASVAESLRKHYPELNVLTNNAGIMKVDKVQNAVDDALVSSIVTTNLLGPVRMTSALIEHLKQQPAAWVIHVTSGTAFVPLAVTAAYSATKAALHLVLAFGTVPAQRHQRQGFGTSPAVCSNRTDGCGTGSRPARHAAARVHRRNAPGIGDRRARGSDRASCLPP